MPSPIPPTAERRDHVREHHGDRVEVQTIGPSPAGTLLGHTGDPGFLLELTRILHGRCPASWLITIPAVALEAGEELSPAARRGLAEALTIIERLLDDPPAAAPAGP